MVRSALAAMAVVTVLWAANFTAAELATREFHWALLASARIFLATAVFAALAPAGTLRTARWRQVLPLAATGIVVNQGCFIAGISLTTPAHSALICALIPAFVMLLAVLFLRESAGPRAVAGMVLAVGGAAGLALGRPLAAELAGDAITLVGVVAFAAYTILGRRIMATEGALATVTRVHVAAVPLAAPLFLYGAYAQDWSRLTAIGWTALAYMVVGATVLCYWLHLWALARLDALKVAVFTDVQPVLAGVIAFAAGVQPLSWPLAAAGAAVLSGVLLVQLDRPSPVVPVAAEATSAPASAR